MAVFTMSWCRIEGMPIPDLEKEYGTFTNLPSGQKVFYGTPEIQINNPTSIVNGCVYKIVPISEFGYDSILEIDGNYATLQYKLETYDKTVDIDHGSIYYYEPFTVDESCIIFYADSTKKTFDHKSIILIDQHATPEIIAITGSYKGSGVPVGETFDTKMLELYTIYADGNKARLLDNYTTDPADKIITVVGSNVVKINYTTPTSKNLTTSVIIEGVKNLQGISALYDGPNVGIGKEALRKYFIVVAQYSDGSSATVTDFSFPSGNVVSETNDGIIEIYYKGFRTYVNIPTYTVSTSRLMAYYNGPNIEVGYDFDINYCKIKIYYASADGLNDRYEDIDPSLCTFSTTMVDHEGVNQITIQYIGEAGPVNTTMVVIGIKPEAVLNFIEAQYIGPEIVVDKSFSAERIICKAHYSNGSIVQIRNFSLNSNVVQYVGPNEYIVTYKEKDTIVTTTITVIGLEKDSTTETGYNPISLQNNYPEATRLNNRYRGPAEARKHDNIDMMIKENILSLYNIFTTIEQNFNELVDSINGNNSIKVKTLNEVQHIENVQNKWMDDKRFAEGKYKQEVKNE